jgi:hypothetical protein
LASFEEHIRQCEKNIAFYNFINSTNDDYSDWKVTVLFYVVVHLVNAHLAKTCNLHFQSHEEVKNALNPENKLSLAKLSEDSFYSYRQIQILSRKSRYLLDLKNGNETASHIKEKDVKDSLKHCNSLIGYFNKLHKSGIIAITP